MKANKLDHLRQLVEARKVKCHNRAFHPNDPAVALPVGVCPECSDTGQVPDPAFAPLLEALREKCSACVQYEAPAYGQHTKGHYHHRGFWSECQKCVGTGYITRNWEGLPIWWPVTLLICAAWEAGVAPVPTAQNSPIKNPEAALDALIKVLEV